MKLITLLDKTPPVMLTSDAPGQPNKMDLSLAVGLSYIIKALLISVVLVLTVNYFYTSRHYDYWKKRGVPYEKPLPFVGSLSFLMRKSFYDYCLEFCKKYPQEYVGIFLGHKPTLMVQSAELARKILVRDADHFEDRYSYASGSTDPMGSLNLFTVKVGAMWIVDSQYYHHYRSTITVASLDEVTLAESLVYNLFKLSHFAFFPREPFFVPALSYLVPIVGQVSYKFYLTEYNVGYTMWYGTHPTYV